jgi:NTP pyrophosphatase (non-canonical NTP hydrolase)
MIRPTIAARSAIEAYGDYEQRQIAVEELAELIVALKHYERHRVGADAVVEEVADVIIVLAQLVAMFGEEAVEAKVTEKSERLMRQITAISKIKKSLNE